MIVRSSETVLEKCNARFIQIGMDIYAIDDIAWISIAGHDPFSVQMCFKHTDDGPQLTGEEAEKTWAWAKNNSEVIVPF